MSANNKKKLESRSEPENKPSGLRQNEEELKSATPKINHTEGHRSSR